MKCSVQLVQTHCCRGGKDYDYWVLRWIDGNGKKRGKNVGSATGSDRISQRQAEIARSEFEQEVSTSPIKRDRVLAPPLQEFLDGYYKSRKGELAHKSLLRTEDTGRHLVTFFGAGRRLDEISRLDARDFKTALSEGKVSKRPITQTSVDLYIRTAKAIFNRAVDDELIELNPFERLTSSRVIQRDWHYIDHDEFNKLLSGCSCITWRVMLALGRLAGLRADEARNVLWKNLDWQSNQLTIVSTDTWTVKDGDSRCVPICPELKAILQQAFEQRGDSESILVPRVTDNAWRDFGFICKRAGVVRYSKPLHSLRKSCLTDWANRFPIHTVKEWAGHTSISTTEQFYLKVGQTDYQQAATQNFFAAQ